MERGCPREALVQERWEVGGGTRDLCPSPSIPGHPVLWLLPCWELRRSALPLPWPVPQRCPS